MYRLLLTILVCLNAASSAPQTKESDVTYVKIQPVVEDTPVAAASNDRESRIEKLPLTIPGNVSKTETKERDKSSENTENRTESPKTSDETDSESLDESASNQSDSLSDASGTDESNVETTDDLSESDSSDSVTSETSKSDRRARNFDSIETTEIPEDFTEKYEKDLIDPTIIEAPKTRAPPKFIAKSPKLSYFQKPKIYQSYSSNALEHGHRRFKSRCSCQKIWNCPKLQITVPRCPNEYFLCCF